jgi:hypothetical protein
MINMNRTSRLFRIVGGERQPRRRASFKPQPLPLEARCLLSKVPIPPGNPEVPIPPSNQRVDLSTIFWNGEAMPLNPGGKDNIPSPAVAGAMKTITITNDGPDMIYPFLRGQNSGIDPNSIGPDGKLDPAPYDPQDLVDHEFREYIGYSKPDGTDYLGLPKDQSITIQVPLVLWDGDNLYLATDGKRLTSSNLFGYDSNAKISIAATAPVSGTTWVQGSSEYPDHESPLVMFYYSGGAPVTLPNDAAAQLTEVTFRDEYLDNFITDPSQTFPLVNYDVSYVNNLLYPVSMEASNAPITYQTNPLPNPPDYYGKKDFGWLATDRDTATFEDAIDDFIHNTGDASIGDYFGKDSKGVERGWPQYYDPDSTVLNIPSGANLFANSPLNVNSGLVHTSSYDPNYWLLTSSGDAPIQAGGAGVGQQGFVNADAPDRIYLGDTSKTFIDDMTDMLKVGDVDVSYPGSTDVLGKADGLVMNPGGKPYVTLRSDIPLSGPSGQVYAFTRPPTDYAVKDITNLWYSWAQYHVQDYKDFAPETIGASLVFTGTHATNEITLDSTPPVDLALGMTVTAPAGIPAGTTILKIVGNDIYLSQIPDDSTPVSQEYTFGKPQPIQYDPQYTTPYKLSFDPADVDATKKARLFAGSVYEAMAVEAGVNPLPTSYLPYSMNLVSQVIQFYAKLPGYDRPNNPTGPILVGEARDIVKSVLRGVYDYNIVTNQKDWYPDPGATTPGLTSGQDFNVYNLDPYVWFVHKVEKMSAYGFSVDDDVANPTATGPLLAADGTPNHDPSNLQIDFGGIKGLGVKTQWFPTTPWGTLTAMATIGVQGDDGDPKYTGEPIVTFKGDDALQVYNEINNPGDGQVGATISAPGYFASGTTLIHKGPTSGLIPSIVLSQKPLKMTDDDKPIPVTITGLTDDT